MADLLDRLKAALSDRYRIERELGSGGMATVYLAEDLKHHRKVAVKVLRPELAAALGPERFHREIEIAANLTHPHILPLHDSGDADGFLYYVMPHIEGESLRDRLAHEGELPIAEAVRILRDVVDALSEAHDKGVVHRDIKPDNVLLTKHHALVTDFGVAKAVSEATGAHKLTTEGVALGTPTYMSPEQAAADPHIDHRADIYAVGVVAYELLTGRTPFLGTTPQMILSAHMTDTPEPVTKYRESVPPALEQLVMKCLEKKAADRWQSAEELLPQLEALATPSGGITPTGTMPVDRRAKRRWMMVGGAVAVAAVVAVIAVVAAIPRGVAGSLDPERIVVAIFRNETGDPSLDQLGSRIGHWITQGLQQAAIKVTPWDGAIAAWQYVTSEMEAGRVREPIRGLAEETGAGTVISGVVYLDNDSLEIHANVTDVATGEPIGTVDPARESRESAIQAIADMQQKVMGLLAIAFDERISDRASGMAQPPSFDAYREFARGLELYFNDPYNDGALLHYHRAFALDSTFVSPLIYATIHHFNNRQWAQADSLVSVLDYYRHRLSEYDRHWLDYLRADVDADRPRALRALRRAAEVAPGSKAVFNLAREALVYHNRPRDAIDALRSLDPERGPMRGWRQYFGHLIRAYLVSGEYEMALAAAERNREIYGDDQWSLQLEALALVALGRKEEVEATVNGIFALPEQDLSLGVAIRGVAVYQRHHQQIDAAGGTIEQLLQWYETRLPETKSSAAWRGDYARALYVVDRWDEAYRLAEPLADENSEHESYRGLAGLIAASRGDREAALETMQWLETLDRSYMDLRGNHTVWRSIISAALGDRESAVAFYRLALTEGYAFDVPWSWWMLAYEPLRAYPPFQQLLRPKG